MDKKYQVFISSTYSDLKEERSKAIDAVLRLEHIPIGMELFNAGDSTQWAIIQRAIDNTDYYILIIGYRYGSVTDEDISYTEKEYDYAVSKNVPVIAFIKDRNLPVTDAERESKAKYQKKLKDFISKVQQREVNYWKTPDELAALITSSLVNQIKLTPRIGWIRADFDPISISQEMAAMMKENRELRKKVDSISVKKPQLEINVLNPDNEEDLRLRYTYLFPEGNITARPLDYEKDLTDKIKDMVTLQDIQTYNENLPAQKEIDDFNERNRLYENAQNNSHCFIVEVCNNGNVKANDIYVDLKLPDGLLAYYDYDIEDIKKPKPLDIPEDPISKAYNKLHVSIVPTAILNSIQFNTQWMNLGAPSLNLNAERLRPGYFDRDHGINDKHDKVVINIDDLIHSRVYTSDKIWFIATRRGTFKIDCKVMCEEYEYPDVFSFEIIVE